MHARSASPTAGSFQSNWPPCCLIRSNHGRRGSDQPSGVLSVIDNWSTVGARASLGSGAVKEVAERGALHALTAVNCLLRDEGGGRAGGM